MVKVLIVDDERLAVKYYTQLINWQFYGFEIIGTAYDGQEALHILEAKEPDIIITDIKMPVMDGIEFAKKAMKINPDIHILFVTSYTDFNYTYSALKLGADDYIMKDLINVDVLVEKLLEIEKKINVKRNENSYKFERVIEEVFTCSRVDQSKLEWLGERSQKLLEGRFNYLYIKQDHFIPAVNALFQDEAEKPETNRITVEICKNFSNEFFTPISVFRFCDGIISVMKTANHNDQELLNYLKQLQSRLEMTLHKTFSIFTVNEPQSVKEAGRIYANSEARTSAQIFLGRTLILEISSPQLTTGSLNEAFDVDFVENCIKANDIVKLRNYLNEFFEKVKKAKDLKAFDFIFYNCLNCFKKYGEGLHGIKTEKASFSDLHERDKNMMYTIPDAMNWIFEKFELLFSAKAEGLNENYSKDTLEIIKYIMNQYGDPNLDVDSISKGVAMSMARSESKFKLETGLTLIDYLNKYRIQKAMEMLENGDVKIYEISEKVGFASSQYFSKVFKKYTALTPIEYRKRLSDEICEKHSY